MDIILSFLAFLWSLSDVVFSTLAFLLVFSGIVIVHEWGHFAMARACGITVYEFAVGFGKRVFGWKGQDGVEYNLRALPLGGYVQMMEDEAHENDPGSFQSAALWKRMAVTLAGVAMNFVAAMVILTVLFWRGTHPILLSEEDILAAEKSGVVTMTDPDENGKRKILDMQTIQLPLGEAMVFATTETARISVAVVKKVGEIPVSLFKESSLPEGIAGPLGIAEVTHKIMPGGIFALLKLGALLSISLAVFNLLPFPALDGGRFVFQVLEFVMGKRPNPKWEGALHYAGFAVLMGLIVMVTFNDVVRMFFS